MKKVILRGRLKHIFAFLAVIMILSGCAALTVDRYVERVGTKYILNINDVPVADAILVLGAYVFPDGTTSSMLNDRLSEGNELYKESKAPKILVSGDHGQKDYDEVNAMKSFLMDKGVPSQDVFMDHAGFSTYEERYIGLGTFSKSKGL